MLLFMTCTMVFSGIFLPAHAQDPLKEYKSFWFLRLRRFQYSPTSPAGVVNAFYIENKQSVAIFCTKNSIEFRPFDKNEKNFAYRIERTRTKFILKAGPNRPSCPVLKRLQSWEPYTLKAVWQSVTLPLITESGAFMIRDIPFSLSDHPPFGRVMIFKSLIHRPLPIKTFNLFPFNKEFRLQAKLIRNPQPREVFIETMRDLQAPMGEVGTLEFSYQGKTYRLHAYWENEGDDSQLFVLFKDKTTGKETYEVGRYLQAEKIGENLYLLDFNKSYLPLCAYSHYYNCPLPPKENNLPFAVNAGEKNAPPPFRQKKN